MSPQKLEAAQRTMKRSMREGAPPPPGRPSLKGLEGKRRQELNAELAAKNTRTKTNPARKAGIYKGTYRPRNPVLNSLRNKTTKASNVNLRVNSKNLIREQQEAFSKFGSNTTLGNPYRTQELKKNLRKKPKSLIARYATEGNKIQQIAILLARTENRDELLSDLKKQPTSDSVKEIDSLLKTQHEELFGTKRASNTNRASNTKQVKTVPPPGLGY